MRNWLGIIVGAVFGIVFVATCGISYRGDHGHGVGDASSPMDLRGADAQTASGSLFSAACDKLRVITNNPGGSPSTTTTEYFADVQVPGLSPESAPQVSVVTCDYQYTGGVTDPIANPCAQGASCSTNGFTPSTESTRCTVGGVVRIGTDHVLVKCGQTSSVAQGAAAGARATSAYVRIN